MGWTFLRNPEQFLNGVNSRCRFVDGCIELIPHEERLGIKAAEGLPQFALGRPFDLVLEAECSQMIENRSTDTFPMMKCARCANQVDEPEQSWLHSVVTTMRPTMVLVYTACCGSFSREYEARIRRLFPNITWFFPETRDFCGNVPGHIKELCEDLLRAEILIVR